MTDSPVQSPYLPNTNIQFAWFKEKAVWLVANATQVDECLISHLAPNAKGYIPISFGRAYKWRAHRVIYFAYNPNADQSLMVLHTCDNRACINLKHLFLGTAQDNTNDMIAKGRKVEDPTVGERRRQITWLLIKSLREQGLTRHEISDKLNLSASTVWNYLSPRGSYYCGSAVTVSSGDESDVCLGFDSTGNAKDLP